jgi:trehalose synthase
VIENRFDRLPTAAVLGHEVPVARGPRARLLGLALLDRERAGAGLLIPRCSAVHTFGMRFPLDLVFLDPEGRVSSARRNVPSRRFVRDPGAGAVLELPCSPGDGLLRIGGDVSPPTMTAREVNVPSLSLERLRGVVDEQAWQQLEAGLVRAVELLGERQVWNVNSTSAGGGVAEMLWSWVGLAQGLNIGMRWLTIDAPPEFFTLTKRLHNYLHGELGDGGALGAEERELYERVSEENAESAIAQLGPDDIVWMHDPQTAGLIPRVVESGRTVIWRCHIGADERNELTAAGWELLAPYVTKAHAAVFSRQAFVPDVCAGMRTAIVPPSIDAASPKNQEMAPAQVRAILRQTGLLAPDGADGAAPVYEAPDESEARVERHCEVVAGGPLPSPDVPLVVQVSRWDRLKDPIGVLRGFAEIETDGHGAHLVLAGPSLDAVSDDPDGTAVLTEVGEEWHRLPEGIRSRVLLACLPMEDLDENAAIVNALQRQATIVVQKSLKEGFGLTVTEAMWKGRPVVATETGGIGDQIEDGVTGVLLRNPLDQTAFGHAVSALLESPERAEAIGAAARESVRANFLENRHMLQYVELLQRVLSD